MSGKTSTIDVALAERHIRQAIQLDSRNAEAYCTFGNILVLRGELAPAVTQYKHALAIDPTLESAQQNLQIAQEQMM